MSSGSELVHRLKAARIKTTSFSFLDQVFNEVSILATLHVTRSILHCLHLPERSRLRQTVLHFYEAHVFMAQIIAPIQMSCYQINIHCTTLLLLSLRAQARAGSSLPRHLVLLSRLLDGTCHMYNSLRLLIDK